MARRAPRATRIFEIQIHHAGGRGRSYAPAARRLLEAYHQIHTRMVEYLAERLPRPEEMKPDMYRRNIAARAFDVARYVLFLGIPTGVGQVTSIRTLERQIRRLKASEYQEVREIAEEIAAACTAPPACAWDSAGEVEPLAPTLARHVDPDRFPAQSHKDIRRGPRRIFHRQRPARSKPCEPFGRSTRMPISPRRCSIRSATVPIMSCTTWSAAGARRVVMK